MARAFEEFEESAGELVFVDFDVGGEADAFAGRFEPIDCLGEDFKEGVPLGVFELRVEGADVIAEFLTVDDEGLGEHHLGEGGEGVEDKGFDLRGFAGFFEKGDGAVVLLLSWAGFAVGKAEWGVKEDRAVEFVEGFKVADWAG